MKLHEIAESHPYKLLFASVTGSRLFGCTSPDSDFDIHGVHLVPVQEVVGYKMPNETIEIKGDTGVDLATHDLKKFVALLLKGNGGVLEDLYSPLVVISTPVHQELQNLGKGCITKQVGLYYKSMAFNQQRRMQVNELKKMIHTYRCLLMGIHLMQKGSLEMNLPTLASMYEQRQVHQLITLKQEGYEHGPDGTKEHMAHFEKLTKQLEDAREKSVLPESPITQTELEQLVVRVRLEGK